MVQPLVFALGGATSVSLGLFLWLWMSRPRPLSWDGRPGMADDLISAAAIGIRRRLSPQALAQADVLRLSPRQLLWMGLGISAIVGLGVAALFPIRWMGIPAGIAAFYLAPSMSVKSQFKNYQRTMRMAFETQVLLLRIYFDLGMPVTTAFRTMRAALHGAAQYEVDRVLSDLAEGNGDAAFREWAERTQLMEYRLLADTIVQQRGRALRGNALDPLDTLLTANRQQSMKTLTDKLMSGGAAVPILSTLSVTTLYLYALMSNVQGLQALNFHF